MAEFSVELYFDKSVTRAELATRISALPELKVESEKSYWSGPVHMVFHELGVERVRGRLDTDFCVDVGVYSYKEEPGQKMIEVLLALLAPGDDALAVCDFSDIALSQRGGQLTIDSSDAVFGDHDRAYFQERRACQFAPLGRMSDR